ncbi:MAG: SpoIIE family protein phosphatase [Bacteroidales bacterium]|nr:SpoIIE family protein phosphatase [Bacteroidales bacterium]
MTYFKHILSLTTALLSSVCAVAQTNDNTLDSLYIALSRQKNNNLDRLETIDKIAYVHYNVDSTLSYAQIELELAQHLQSHKHEAKAYNYMAWGSYVKGNYIKTCDYATKAISAAEKIDSKTDMGKGFYYIANAYSMMKDAVKADTYFHKALALFTETNDDTNMCKVLRNMAQMNSEYTMYDAAEDCYNRAIDIDRQNGNRAQMAEDYIGLGYIEQQKYENNEPDAISHIHQSLLYTQTARKLAKETASPYYIMRADIYMANQMLTLSTFTDDPLISPQRRKELHDSTKVLIDESFDICTKCGYEDEQQGINNAYANWLITDKQYKKAEAFLDSLEIVFNANKDEHLDDLLGLYETFSNLYESNGSYEMACQAKDKYLETYINSLQIDYAAKSAQSIAEAEYEKQMRDREIEYEAESRVRTWAIYAISTILLLVLILAILSIRNYIQSRKINNELDEKNQELESQKEEIIAQNERLEEKNEQIESQSRDLKLQNAIISETNKQMKDSINYAKVIQEATLPSDGQMESLFGSVLIIYRPLNIVSGDFYWAQQVGNLKMLAVGDCTGHGVPGAFLSMLGISILNEIAANYQPDVISAGTVLDKMRTMFKQALHQRGGDETSQDGIDLALVIIDPKGMVMHYAGAYRPIIFIRDGEAQKLEHDKMPIGSHHRETEHFKDHTIDLMPGDAIYMYSDGMTDQFGYDSNHEEHKFGDKKLIPLLRDICRQPFSVQKTKIEMTIDNWRLDSNMSDRQCEQTDDALIVGIRV